MRKRAALSACLVLLCALSLAGCANSIVNLLPRNTAQQPGSSVAPRPAALGSCAAGTTLNHGLIAACQRLGDLTTLDPCSLISVSELPPDLAAVPDGRDSLDSCDFTITAGPDKDVMLEVGALSTGGPMATSARACSNCNRKVLFSARAR